MNVNPFDQNNPVQSLYSFSLRKSERKYLWLNSSLSLLGLAVPEVGCLSSEDTFGSGLVSLFSVPRHLTALWIN